ncbi:hypothetical protein N7456_006102 [Penicillium angulare]|uniref:Uncharacterized protein n=1 Tax=Penicillium angulare TaxID=116970 RepID=A0A9W9KL65_9EURO|nr:hypothetical protein N7456_006102 [Penicillium angulare]
MLRFPGRAKFRSLASNEPPGDSNRDDSLYENPFEDPISNTQSKTGTTATSIDEYSKLEPQALKPYHHRWLAIAGCLAGIIPFFGLAWAAVGLHGRGITQNAWNGLQIAMKVEVTLFPLVYAAIVGRMCRQLAHWELQRGASVSKIQRFMGSTTVFGTVYTSWTLWSLNLIGIGLTLLWILSPLAAQASLRILSASHTKTSSSPRLDYLNFTGTDDLTDLSSWKWSNDPADEMFIGSMVTAKITKGSTTDLWGNVKVPLLSSLGNGSDSSDWITVTGDDVVYTSQLGVPIMGLLGNGSTSTTIETSYMDFQCYNLHDMSFDSANISAIDVPKITYTNGTETEAAVNWKSLNFAEGWEREKMQVAEANCTVTLQTISIDMSCSRTGGNTRSQGTCAATRIRKAQPGNSALPRILSSAMVFNNFTESIHNAVPTGQVTTPTVLDYWMSNPYGTYPALTANITLYELDPQIFSQRLTQMINSFYMSRLGYRFMTRTSLTGLQLSASGDETIVKSDTGSAKFSSASGKGIHVNSDLTLHTDPGWITAFILTIVVMVLASILTFYLGSTTLIPDILGYVSSLTRNNPHIPVSDVSVVVGGLQRTRLLGPMVLRMGDTTPGDDVGTLAVGRLSSTTRSNARRLYR